MKFKLFVIAYMMCNMAFAQEVINAPMACFNTDKLFKDLKEIHEETPIIVGKATDMAGSTMSFWVSKNDTWSIVATLGDVSCLVGVGINLSVLRKRGVGI